MKVKNYGVDSWRDPQICIHVDKEFVLAAIELMETKIVEDAAEKKYDSITDKAKAREQLVEVLEEYNEWEAEQASKEPDGEDE